MNYGYVHFIVLQVFFAEIGPVYLLQSVSVSCSDRGTERKRYRSFVTYDHGEFTADDGISRANDAGIRAEPRKLKLCY